MNSGSKPPNSSTYFLDESLDSSSVASALRESGAIVIRHTERFQRGVADEVWPAEAGRNGWIVLTRDKRIRYRKLEREALKAANARAFVFTGGNVTAKETGAILAKGLRKMERICQSVPGPFIYHLGRSGKPVRME